LQLPTIALIHKTTSNCTLHGMDVVLVLFNTVNLKSQKSFSARHGMPGMPSEDCLSDVPDKSSGLSMLELLQTQPLPMPCLHNADG